MWIVIKMIFPRANMWIVLKMILYTCKFLTLSYEMLLFWVKVQIELMIM